MQSVVIVDDNNSQLMLLKLLLNQIGIEPISFLDPLQALEYIKKHKIDLLMSDYNMPGMNGVELIFEAKSFFNNLKAAVVSGLADSDGVLRRECESLNIPLLLKPFDAIAFRAFMRELLLQEFTEVYCISHKERYCILRDKVATDSCMSCCEDERKDDKDIIQCVVDTLDDFYPSEEMIVTINNKLSYMANTVNSGQNSELEELFAIVKQLAVMLYEHKEKILEDKDILFLVTSYLNVVSEWLEDTFLAQEASEKADNYDASIKADFQSIEIALGLCVEDKEDYAELDDLFF